MTLGIDGSGPLDLKLRAPYWAGNGFTVRVNGVVQRLGDAPEGYVTLSRTWKPGDKVQITMPFTLRAEKALDAPSIQSLAYGPVPMVALSDETSYRGFSF